jgi:hypothetical protein
MIDHDLIRLARIKAFQQTNNCKFGQKSRGQSITITAAYNADLKKSEVVAKYLLSSNQLLLSVHSLKLAP